MINARPGLVTAARHTAITRAGLRWGQQAGALANEWAAPAI